MTVKVYGALFFVGSGSKLAFPCNSHVELMTEDATVNGDSSGNSQTIKICGTVYWAVSDGRMSGYLIWPGTSLPVELIYFEGNAAEGSAVLQWATASETASDRFELYRRSGDGMEARVADVSAAGFSQALTTYRYQDHIPLEGSWIYRLVQFDIDGTSTVLGSVVVHVKPGLDLLCYPVPATGQLTIVTSSIPSTMVIRDMVGRAVLRITLTSQSTVIPVDEFPNGSYVAQMINGDRVSSQRVQVAH